MSLSAGYLDRDTDSDGMYEIRTRTDTKYRWSDAAAAFWEDKGAEVVLIDLREIQVGGS